MKVLCTCPNSHVWEIDLADAEPIGEPACPTCGSISSSSHRRNDTGIDRDSGPTIAPAMSVPVADEPRRDQREVNTVISDSRPKFDLGPTPTVPGYEIRSVLGRGGMGVVYRARQNALGREVALKMILAGPHVGPDLVARFRQEAESVARLQHTNIVQVYEVGSADGLPYIALELIEGGSLAKRLGGRLQTPRMAAETVLTLAEAIHVAHEHGILHRDLKPENVLVGSGGTLKITDFGLAKRVDGGSVQTMTGDVVGTPTYMAPEQAGGVTKQLGPPCDVYSLGVILYEMLTGRPPIVRQDPVETLMAVLSEEPIPPRRLLPKTPRDLETICLKCLEKSPRKRYATAQELADDLRRFLRHEPISARPTSTLERGIKWAKRRPAKALAIAVLLIGPMLAAGALALHNDRMWWQWQQTIAEKEAREATLAQSVKANEEIFEYLSQNRDPLAPLDDGLLNILLNLCDNLLQQNPNDPGVKWLYGKAHRMRGGVFALRGHATDANREFRQAIGQLEALVAADPDKLDYQRDLAATYLNLGRLLDDQGDATAAQSADERAISIYERIAKANPANLAFATELAVAYNNLGVLTAERRNFEASLKWHTSALKLRNSLVRRAGDSRDLERDLAVSQLNLGSLYQELNQTQNAEESYSAAAKVFAKLAQDENATLADRAGLASVRNNLARMWSLAGKDEQAEEAYRGAADQFRQLTTAAPHVRDHWRRLASTNMNLGLFLAAHGRGEEARSAFEEALAIQERESASPTASFESRVEESRCVGNLSQIDIDLGHFKEAEPRVERGLELAERLVETDADNADAWDTYATMLDLASQTCAGLARGNAAIAYRQDALEAQKEAVRLAGTPSLYVAKLKLYYNELSDLALTMGEPTVAQEADDALLALGGIEGDDALACVERRCRAMMVAQTVKSLDFDMEAAAQGVIDLLDRAVNDNEITLAQLRTDPRYAPLRDTKAFHTFLASLDASVAASQPTSSADGE